MNKTGDIGMKAKNIMKKHLDYIDEQRRNARIVRRPHPTRSEIMIGIRARSEGWIICGEQSPGGETRACLCAGISASGESWAACVEWDADTNKWGRRQGYSNEGYRALMKSDGTPIFWRELPLNPWRK